MEPVENKNQILTANWIDLLAGIWLLISPFIIRGFASTATSNCVIFGIIIGVLSLVRFGYLARGVWLSWVNFILGIWVLISPWVLRFSHEPTATWNSAILGIIVIVFSLWAALATPGTRRTHVTV